MENQLVNALFGFKMAHCFSGKGAIGALTKNPSQSLKVADTALYISKVKVADTPFHIQGEDLHLFKSMVMISILYLMKTQNNLITIDYLPFSLDFFQYATCCFECKAANGQVTFVKLKFKILNSEILSKIYIIHSCH